MNIANEYSLIQIYCSNRCLHNIQDDSEQDIIRY